nr:nucleoside phosphorylase [Caldovatus aquaticus]
MVVVGLRREAALLPEGVAVVCTGGDPRRAARLLAARGGAGAVLSFGLAGALDPALGPGTLLAATEIRSACGAVHPADPAWSARLAAVTGARRGPLAGAGAVAATPEAKRALRAATGALAVDLESEPAAAFAAARGVPFAALRAVADTAAEPIPPAALAGVAPDGRAAPLGVLCALARRPGDLADLLRLARRSRAALAALARAAALLGRDLGCRAPALLPLLLLGERLLDMA